MTNQEAWKEFQDRLYTKDFENFSDLLGSDWRAGAPFNQTASQYREAAYRRMITRYGFHQLY